jgi:hypothetical protein
MARSAGYARQAALPLLGLSRERFQNPDHVMDSAGKDRPDDRPTAIADDSPHQGWQPVGMTSRLSHSFSGALPTFSYWVANGTLGQPILDGIDYGFVLSEEPVR